MIDFKIKFKYKNKYFTFYEISFFLFIIKIGVYFFSSRQGLDNLFDLNDLTWEQKEQVLRELFARMNGMKTKKNKSDFKAVELNETINDADSNEDDNDVKYIDRQNLNKNFNNRLILIVVYFN